MAYRGPRIVPPAPRRKADDVAHDDAPDPVELAQQPLVDAADRIADLAERLGLEGITGCAVADDARELVLYWKGDIPRSLDELLDELRATVRVDVRSSAYSRDELLKESERIISVESSRTGVKITQVGPLADGSGLGVGVERASDLARARRSVRSSMPLTFVVEPGLFYPASAAPLR